MASSTEAAPGRLLEGPGQAVQDRGVDGVLQVREVPIHAVPEAVPDEAEDRLAPEAPEIPLLDLLEDVRGDLLVLEEDLEEPLFGGRKGGPFPGALRPGRRAR